MKRTLVYSLLSCTLLVACTSTKRSSTQYAPFPRESDSTGMEGIPPTPGEVIPGTTEVAPTPAPTPQPMPDATPAPKREARYGLQEAGKPGFMRSPYHPEAGLIDYRGLPPGQEVKDPYTPGKIILVP